MPIRLIDLLFSNLYGFLLLIVVIIMVLVVITAEMKVCTSKSVLKPAAHKHVLNVLLI